MITFLAVLIVGFILWGEIGELKKRIQALESGEREVKPQVSPATQPAAVHAPVTAEPVLSTVHLDARPAAVSPVGPKRDAGDAESQITGRWFAIIGIVALLFGVGFFLKYAFDQNLITQTGRVILGLLAGLVLLGLGDFLHRKEKYKEYSHFLSGGGLAMLYLSIYAAFGFYDLISLPAAFAGMIAVTAIGCVLSAVSDSIQLAGMSIFGGFIAPYLVVSGVNMQAGLMGYVVVLNLGFLILMYMKQWRALYPLSFVGTYAIFFSWLAAHYSPGQLLPTMLFLTAFFLTFLAAPLFQTIFHSRRLDNRDLLFLAANNAFYFLSSYFLLLNKYEHLLGGFFAGWAIIFFLLAYALKRSHREDMLGYGAFAGMGLVLITAAIPIQLSSSWITAAWTMEAIVLAALGLFAGSKGARMFSHLVALGVILRLMVFDAFNIRTGTDITAFANSRFFIFLAAAVGTFVIAYLYDRFRDKAEGEDKAAVPAYFVLGTVILLGHLYLETSRFNLSDVWLTIAWAAESALLLLAGFGMRSMVLRILSVGAYAALLLRLLFENDLPYGEPFMVFINPRFPMFLLAALVGGLAAWLYREHKAEVGEDEELIAGGYAVVANLVAVWGLSLEALSYFDSYGRGSSTNQKNLSLSLIWGFYAGILMLVGIVKRLRLARMLGLLGLAVVILKVFLYDAAALSDVYRIISFIVLGVLLLLISFVFYRFKDKFKEFILADS